MSILDDAIRDHLALKRAHGADESELKRLEDEAFGPPERPDELDPFAEAPTEFLSAAGLEEDTPAPDGGEEPGDRRRINVADLQEPPPPKPSAPEQERPHEEDVLDEAAAQPEPTAMEHEVVLDVPLEPEPDAHEPQPPDHEPEQPPATVADPGPTTEEREAIAEQPTQIFDVESARDDESEPAPGAPVPSDEEILDEELSEPRLTAAGLQDEGARLDDYDEEGDDDFWSDQRLSEELDQALEAPLEEEPSEEYPAPANAAAERDPDHADEHEHPEYEPAGGHEDVLEDTPEFLEDAPEDDELWFEQRPPKDFDFDD